MFTEFKKFALRGNAIDMAVGIIIGAAFSKIVSSLVEDIIMPPVGMLLGKLDFSDFVITLYAKTAETDAVTINYGLFINNVINFLIVAFTIFMVIRQMNKVFKKQEATPKTQTCPHCDSKISKKASRCPQCTSKLAAAS